MVCGIAVQQITMSIERRSVGPDTQHRLFKLRRDRDGLDQGRPNIGENRRQYGQRAECIRLAVGCKDHPVIGTRGGVRPFHDEHRRKPTR